jgi:hypothetical protein
MNLVAKYGVLPLTKYFLHLGEKQFLDQLEGLCLMEYGTRSP